MREGKGRGVIEMKRKGRDKGQEKGKEEQEREMTKKKCGRV